MSEPAKNDASAPPSRRTAGAAIKSRRARAGWLAAGVCVAAIAGYWVTQHPSSDTSAHADAASAAASAAGPGHRRFDGAGNAQTVSVEAARRQDIRVSVSAIGSLAASNLAIVHAQVSGVLQDIHFKEGQQVRAGQPLAQIDPRAFQASLGQAEGALARDRAQLENARIDLERYRGLLTKDAIPKQQLDTQVALVRQLEGTVRTDEATADSARLQLIYTRVIAPISGRVGLKQVDLGNVVQPADANGIVSIAQTRPISLVFAVPAAHVALLARRLGAGEAVAVEAWDRGGKDRLAVGRVASLDNAIDPTTDTIKVKAMFPNADDVLFPNQAVSVVLQLDVLGDVLAVPQAAVLRGAQGFYVYRVNADGSVGTCVVKPGPVDAGWMAVEGALQAGDKVVIDGTDRLREGAKVEVIAADPRQRAGAGAPAGERPHRQHATSDTAPANAQAAGRAAPGASATPESSSADRPRWMDRVSPQQTEMLQAMSPDERRAWFRAQREARDAASSR